MDKKKVKRALWVLCVVWAAVIFIGCVLPSNVLPSVKFMSADKVAHFCFFFVLCVLLGLLLCFKTKQNHVQIVLLVTLSAFLYGGIIELLQSELFDRTRDLYDLIADVAGGFVGGLCYRWFAKRLKIST